MYPDYRTAVERAKGHGIRIRFIDTQKLFPEKQFSTTHSKMLIVDGKFVFIGSSNWTTTSMRENCEVGIFTKDPSVASDAKRIFDRDWEFSEE
jgi:phosphatidylserine/phosphatidylglycerophosphate/cardiolipin synthase-like enzyme